jgi:hypothetical protein
LHDSYGVITSTTGSAAIMRARTTRVSRFEAASACSAAARAAARLP